MRNFIQLLVLMTFMALTACSLFSREEEEKQASSSQAATHEQPAEETPAEEVSGISESSQSPTHTVLHWSYEGDHGPEAWGDLKPEYSLCKTGAHQSPVDLIYKKPQSNRPIKVSYQETTTRVIDNGHTVQLNFDPGNTIELDGVTYQLTQAQFHTPSEHTISGNRLPMELQLIHQGPNDELAVLGVILIEGTPHSIVESIWQNMPIQKGMEKELNFKINPNDLIPQTRTYYHYTGSLTTPPCTEGVSWNVFNTPVTLSKEQILTFRQLYPNNSRPVQPLGDRATVNYK